MKLTYQDLLEKMTNMEMLAIPPEKGEMGGNFSSYDRNSSYDPSTDTYSQWGANRDCDGYIRMEKASFVFIDEFDAFYHFELSESVQRHLNQIAGVQIFTTTHNTDLMSNDLLRPDSYFLLANNSIKAISQLTEKELRQAHNLQKMYKAGAFNGK